jgi:hypothetical protein
MWCHYKRGPDGKRGLRLIQRRGYVKMKAETGRLTKQRNTKEYPYDWKSK